MTEQHSQLLRIAQQVRTRLALSQWLTLLGKSALVVFVSATTVTVGLWYLGQDWVGVGIGAAIVLVWLLTCATISWFRRPDEITALADLDERAGRHEELTSAFCFLSEDAPTAGEKLHIARATEILAEDDAPISSHIPLQVQHRSWLAPVAFLLVLAFALVRPEKPVEARMEGDEIDRAKAFAEKMEYEKNALDDGKHLEKDEQEKLTQLHDSLDDTIKKMSQLDDATRREVLAELEQRARQAESLAAGLSGEGQALSSEMLAELERHTDTADFASAARAEKPDKIADESNKIADKLSSEKLSSDEQNRFENALDKALAAANQQDKNTEIGKHLDEAKKRLKKKNPKNPEQDKDNAKDAAEEFRKLAKRMTKSLQRRQSQQKLQQLAKQLRAAGQNIFGKQNQIQRLAQQNNPNGLKRLGNGQAKTLNKLALGKPNAGQMGQKQMALVPGQPNAQNNGQQMIIPGGQQGNPNGQAPIPGQGQPMSLGQQPGQGALAGQIPIPGSGQIPGQGAGQIPGQGNSPGQGQGAPIPGQGSGSPSAGQASQGAGQGGHSAGHGSAAYANNQTKPHAATNSLTVDGRKNANGASLLRNIEGAQHQEDTSRQATNEAIEFLKTQEEALADEPLPVTRREQVLRYFTALRRTLVESPETNE